SPTTPHLSHSPVTQFAPGVIGLQELEAGGVEALRRDLNDTAEQLVAQIVVLVSLAAQAFAVERDRAGRLRRMSVEPPSIGRNEPGPAQDVARSKDLDRHRRMAPGRNVDHYLALSNEIELVGV